MFSLEPQRTQFDLHFPIFGIPTRIHPGFWLVSFLLGFSVTDQGTKPLPLLIYIAVIFVSILVHELGHALVMRRFGFSPRIVLYHLGGLAITDQGFAGGFEKRRGRRDTWESILISLAGPGAGFLLAAVVVLVVFASRGRIGFDPTHFPQFWTITLPARTSEHVYDLVHYLLFVNIFWGLVNLAPVFPLDGGQIARELLTQRDRYNGLTHALQLSIGVGIALAAVFFIGGERYAAIMFALLAVSNYLMLQQLGRYS